MLNQTKNTVAPRNSKAIAKARRNRKLVSLKVFSQLYQGSFCIKKTRGIFYCKFNSLTTGKCAHAWGDSVVKAYRNMMRNFNHKYAS